MGTDHASFKSTLMTAKITEQLKSENEKLKEDLQKAENQIEARFFLGAGGRFDGRLHLAFLFATPLVIKKSVPSKGTA
jgi:thiamine pyrophosphokinase